MENPQISWNYWSSRGLLQVYFPLPAAHIPPKGSEGVGVLGFDESQVQHRDLQYSPSSVQL